MQVLFITVVFLGLIQQTTQYSDKADLLISVDPERQRLVDTLGRERHFHGTNVVYKHFPFHPQTEGYNNESFSEIDMKLLQSLGLNVIRLETTVSGNLFDLFVYFGGVYEGMMLPGFVPKRGQYNQTYLDVIRGIVTKASEYGIYTLLDMHQDVMSPKFCVEGFPDWAVDPGSDDNFPFPLDDKYPLNPKTGYPYPEDCGKQSWGNYYFTEAASAAFQRFYNNTNGLLDAVADFWKETAKAFKSYDSVIGYELINEPWAGDIYKNTKLMIPGVADVVNLQPAYDVMQKAIRSVDDLHTIFFEGVTWDFILAGFTQVPGGNAYQNRSVLSYHYYEPPDFSKTLAFAARMSDLRRLKCGGFLTELATTGKIFKGMEEMFDLCDLHQQSWMGWVYKPYGCIKFKLACLPIPQVVKDGELHDIMVQNTSRTYPQAVAGYTKRFSFNVTTKDFYLSYTIKETCKSKESIVYFNRDMHYPNGIQVTVTPNEHVKWSVEGSVILITHDSALYPGDTVTFSLKKK